MLGQSILDISFHLRDDPFFFILAPYEPHCIYICILDWETKLISVAYSLYGNPVNFVFPLYVNIQLNCIIIFVNVTSRYL